MEDIVASLPESVLNYRDVYGRSIIDYAFDPFENVFIVAKKDYLNEIIREKEERVIISAEYPISRDDIIELIERGGVRALRYELDERLELEDYHIDFVSGNIRISSYYGEIESPKTVVLNSSTCKVLNDLIRLGDCTGTNYYWGKVLSNYIHYSQFVNVSAKHFIAEPIPRRPLCNFINRELEMYEDYIYDEPYLRPHKDRHTWLIWWVVIVGLVILYFI